MTNWGLLFGLLADFPFQLNRNYTNWGRHILDMDKFKRKNRQIGVWNKNDKIKQTNWGMKTKNRQIGVDIFKYAKEMTKKKKEKKELLKPFD